MRQLVGSAAVVLMSASALAAAMPQLEEEHQLRMTYETAHLNWGKPWFKGTMKVLFFCVGKYEFARDAVELMQRFDMKITPVYFRHNRKVLHLTSANVDREFSENPPGSDGVQRLQRLLQEKWDLFLFGNIDPDVLPPECQYYMYRQVADGAGILVVGPDKPDKVMTAQRETKEAGPWPLGVQFYRLPAALPWLKNGEKPEDLEGRLVRAYRLGKGRGVHLALPSVATTIPRMEASPETLNELEYWYALVGELAIWAAGREVSEQEMARLSSGGAKLVVRTRADRLDGCELMPWTQVPLKGQPGRALLDALAQMDLKRLPAGPGIAVAAAVMECEGKKVRFAVAPINVPSPTAQRIEAIALHKDFCEPGEQMTGTVSLADADYSGWTLRVEARDCWGRVLARQEIPLQASARQVPFVLPTSGDCSIYMRAEASLWRGDTQVTAPTVAEFRVPQRRRGVFHQVQWDSPGTAVGYWAMLRLRQLGWDINLGGLRSTLPLADVPLIPYTTRLLEEHDEHGIMKPCCW
ncbi:MAG: hypothetical protein H5T86_07955, partial [Armatimonadetes bacterium]|nr:hypothetical protein [Armatimonadota bacterium]